MTLSRRQFIQAAGALTVAFSVPAHGTESQAAISGMATLGNRLSIDTSGTVHLLMGKVELGQGIGTAMAQLVAEELDLDVSRIRLARVNTEHSPDESYTFSSISVQQSGPPTRRAAATARAFLLERAGKELGVPVSRLGVDDGRIILDGNTTELDYWQLLENQQFKLDVSSEVPLKTPDDYRVVGQSTKRLDIPGKVFGETSFLQDVRLPDMVHARIVRPAAERAVLKRHDFEYTEKMPGVLKVVRDGNFVGVIAEREGQARDAANQLKKDLYWELPEDLPDSTRLSDWLKQAKQRREAIADERLGLSAAAATRTIRASYERAYQAHASISPSAAIALFQNGALTVLSHAQGMYPLKIALAHTLGLEPAQVSCFHYEASGCYGHNGADDAACDASVLAMAFPDRPVRLQWERADEFTWEPYGPAMHIEASASIDRSGKIRAWSYDLWSCPHANRPRSVDDVGHFIYARHRKNPFPAPAVRSIPQPSGGADRNGIPLYDFDNLNVTKHLVTDLPIRVSSLRGLGAYGNVFAIESFMDELANVVHEDPLVYRLMHLSDDRGIAVLEKLAEVSGWNDREDDDDGWGLGIAQFKNRSSYVGVVMRVQVDKDSGAIRLIKATAVCDAGTVINPDGTKAQIEGGIIQSASWTIKEQVRFSRVEKQSIDWASYPILRFDEVPEVEVVLMEGDGGPSLGVGEAAQGPTAAAIANAVFDKSNNRIRKLPLMA
jgi:nicotinate dehydrogenase subunit B